MVSCGFVWFRVVFSLLCFDPVTCLPDPTQLDSEEFDTAHLISCFDQQHLTAMSQRNDSIVPSMFVCNCYDCGIVTIECAEWQSYPGTTMIQPSNCDKLRLFTLHQSRLRYWDARSAEAAYNSRSTLSKCVTTLAFFTKKTLPAIESHVKSEIARKLVGSSGII